MHTYPELLQEVKDRIRKAQVQATMSANAELLLMYWDVGRLVAARQAEKGWGTSIIPRKTSPFRMHSWNSVSAVITTASPQ